MEWNPDRAWTIVQGEKHFNPVETTIELAQRLIGETLEDIVDGQPRVRIDYGALMRLQERIEGDAA